MRFGAPVFSTFKRFFYLIFFLVRLCEPYYQVADNDFIYLFIYLWDVTININSMSINKCHCCYVYVKGIFHPKILILSLITHPHVVPNL